MTSFAFTSSARHDDEVPAVNRDLHGMVPETSASSTRPMTRDFHIVVPADCVASESATENRYALEQMRKFLKADVRPGEKIDLEALLRRDRAESRRSDAAGAVETARTTRRRARPGVRDRPERRARRLRGP